MALLLALGATGLVAARGAAQSEPPPGSIAMRWNDCYGADGASLRTFACNTNSGVEQLVVTAFPPADISQLNGAAVVVDLLGSGGSLPSWWQLGTGLCRTAATVIGSFIPPSGIGSCGDPWLGSGSGGVSYTYPYIGLPGMARLRGVVAIPGTTSIAAGDEVFICTFQILHSKTVGAGSCDGCSSGICIGLGSVLLTQPIGVGDYRMLKPLPGTTSDYVSWQESLTMTSSLYPYHGGWMKDFTGCLAVNDAARPTWGGIKRLYR